MKKLCFLIFLLAFFPSFVFAYTFSNNISFGLRGQDVLELQKVLNSDQRTIVSTTGLGSKGLETDYFGLLTRDAVVRFQELYAKEVLYPAGLYRGTGFVGSLTRQKLNSLTKIQVATTTAVITKKAINKDFSTNSNISSQLSSDNIFPYSLSSYSAKKGATVYIYGEGFGDKNTIYFGDKYMLANVSKISSTTMAFSVPDELPIGRYDFKIGNGKNVSTRSLFITITDGSVGIPKINSISPSVVKYGTTVTVFGENFSKINQVRTIYGAFEALSNDGKTISFVVKPHSEIPERFLRDGETKALPFIFFVVSDGGFSEQSIINVEL